MNRERFNFRWAPVWIWLMPLIFVNCASTPRARRVEALKSVQDEVEILKRDKADMNVRLDDLKTEVQILSGKIEENQHFIRKTQKSLDTNDQRLDKLISGYDKKIISLETAMDQEHKKYQELHEKLETKINELGSKLLAFETQKAKVAEAKTDVRYDYMNGLKRFEAKEYSSAITLFTRYISNFPAGRSIHNARYYLSESYFRTKDYQNAILKYEEYKEKSPKGAHVAEAIYKQALAFKGLGKISDAKLFLEDLIANYPASPFAKDAKVELERLK